MDLSCRPRRSQGFLGPFLSLWGLSRPLRRSQSFLAPFLSQ